MRYWAASARPGTDTAFDEAQMKVGRRLAIKLLNASKFALVVRRRPTPPRWTLPLRSPRRSTARCSRRSPDLVDEATAAFEAFDYARALERTEAFFWRFCDDYLELVKGRAYGDGDLAGSQLGDRRAARPGAVDVCTGCSHRSCPSPRGGLVVVDGRLGAPRPWPDADELRSLAAEGDALALEVAGQVLSELRGAKSAAKVSMRAEIERAVITDTPDRLTVLATVQDDVAAAAKVVDWSTAEGDTLAVDTTIAVPPTD